MVDNNLNQARVRRLIVCTQGIRAHERPHACTASGNQDVWIVHPVLSLEVVGRGDNFMSVCGGFSALLVRCK